MVRCNTEKFNISSLFRRTLPFYTSNTRANGWVQFFLHAFVSPMFSLLLLLWLKLSHNFLRFMEKSVVSIGKRTCSSPEGWIANVFRLMFYTFALQRLCHQAVLFVKLLSIGVTLEFRRNVYVYREAIRKILALHWKSVRVWACKCVRY